MASRIVSASDRDTTASDGPAMMTANRPVGAAVGSAIAIVAAFLAYGIGQTDFLGVGIPAAALSGWLLGPTIQSRGGVVGPGIGMATLTIAIADALFILGSLADPASSVQTFSRAFELWLVGLVFVGIPMLVVTVPCGVVWVLAVRKLASDGFHIGAATQRDAV
jgi:hypothetical protein